MKQRHVQKVFNFIHIHFCSFVPSLYPFNFSILLFVGVYASLGSRARRLLDRCEHLAPLDGPIDEELGFLPASVHRFALQDDHDEEVTILFKAAGEAGSGSLSDTRLDPGKAINTQEAIRVHPAVASLLVSLEDCFILGFYLRQRSTDSR